MNSVDDIMKVGIRRTGALSWRLKNPDRLTMVGWAGLEASPVEVGMDEVDTVEGPEMAAWVEVGDVAATCTGIEVCGMFSPSEPISIETYFLKVSNPLSQAQSHTSVGWAAQVTVATGERACATTTVRKGHNQNIVLASTYLQACEVSCY